MGSIFEPIIEGIIEVVKFIVSALIWGVVLFYIGYAILMLVTFFKYPSDKQLEKQVNVISCVGLNGVYISWACIATYNFNENMYFLLAGVVVAIFQTLLISLKYYAQDKGKYEY